MKSFIQPGLLVLLTILSIFSISNLPIQAKAAQPVVGANIPILGESSPDRQQVEPTIAVDPRNPNIIVAGAQDYRLIATGGHRWHGYYRSIDGGNTWSQTLLPGFPGDVSAQGQSSALKAYNGTTDPVVAWDTFGNLYYAGIALAITPIGITVTTAFVAKYVNDGADYSGVVLIAGFNDADKPWIAVDTSWGPNNGNIYLVFDATIGGLFTNIFTRSTDGGKTFSTPFKTPSSCGQLPGVTADPSGNVYVSTFDCDPTSDILINQIQVSKVTSGGTVLASTVSAVNPITPLPSPLPRDSFRTFTIPQITSDSKGVYLVWDNYRTGDANVMITRSVDGGATWTSPAVVNDVTTGQQFFSTITASAGIVSVAWYDSRFSNSTLSVLDVFYAQSTDAGASFSPSVRVTTVSFNPNLVKRTDAPNYNETFMGDYLGITASPTAVHIIWPDDRSACDTVDTTYGCVDQDVYTATINVVPPQPVHDVAVYGMTVSRNFDYAQVPSNPIRVDVTAVNLGSVSEKFTVKIKANSTMIGSQNITLAPGASMVARFDCLAQTLARGNYTLSATASAVNGETNLSNNLTLGGEFNLRFPGDVNNDCRVNIADLVLVATSFQTTPASKGWNPNADLNNDGMINIQDLTLVAANFGLNCS